MIDPEHVITSATQLREIVPPARQAQQTKVLPSLDDHCRRWIAASPFLVIASAGDQGSLDLSPKGDPAGFVRIIDDQTLAIPDRPGNRRHDTYLNIIERPDVALMFMVPGRGEVLRISGTAQIVNDPTLLETMAAGGRNPALALVVRLTEVMFHCGKSVIRSKLWSPDGWPAIDHLATYAECIADQATSDETVDEMTARFATWHDGNELY